MKRVMFLTAASWLAMAPAVASDDLTVTKDESKVIRLATPAATVVVGNPMIADVTMQDGTTAFITGKGFGSTNIIAMDASGHQIATFRVIVSAGSNRTVTLMRGSVVTTLSCAPRCEAIATASLPEAGVAPPASGSSSGGSASAPSAPVPSAPAPSAVN